MTCSLVTYLLLDIHPTNRLPTDFFVDFIKNENLVLRRRIRPSDIVRHGRDFLVVRVAGFGGDGCDVVITVFRGHINKLTMYQSSS